jgi:ribosomal protein S27AE
VDFIDTQDLESRLRLIRHRRIAHAVVFLVLPLAILAYYHAPWSAQSRTALLLGWVVVYSFSTMLVAWSRCPRCAALYFLAKPLFRVDPFRTSCGNCGCELSEGD